LEVLKAIYAAGVLQHTKLAAKLRQLVFPPLLSKPKASPQVTRRYAKCKEKETLVNLPAINTAKLSSSVLIRRFCKNGV
jgi:hypothetical protein